ncbi:hypothetical protein ABFS83_04G186700 [Erythranthe nasuta]
MGRVFSEEFVQIYPDYYMCKSCGTTPIASPGNHLSTCLEESGQRAAFFTKALNVQVDEPVHYYKVDHNTVSDIYCVKCGNKLGWKFIRVGENQMVVRNGFVRLMM